MKKLLMLLSIIFVLSCVTKVSAEELILIPNVCTESTVKTPDLTFGALTEVSRSGINPLYLFYLPHELDLLFRVVEAETYGWNYEHHRNVANVIFNRIRNGWGSLTEVLTAPRQFMVVTTGFYKMVEVSPETIKACEDAWLKDYTHGALYFDSTNGSSYAAAHCRFLFRDGAGHDFYK